MKQELILEVIRERWSPYSFSSAPVEEFKLKAMFEAACCAPSCNNEQPWLFVYTTRQEREVFDDYLGFLSDSNKVWVENSGTIIISMARTRFSHNGKPNRFAFHDTGMAVANLLIQAKAFDINVHQMAGYSVEKVRNYFNLTEDIEPVAMMAVGYLGDGESLSPDLLKRDESRRLRKPLKDVVFKKSLDNPAF